MSGAGSLIFGSPPAECAVHPADGADTHEVFLMCDDIKGFMVEMEKHGVPCSTLEEPRWGSLTRITLPGGSALGVYQPKHPSPPMR